MSEIKLKLSSKEIGKLGNLLHDHAVDLEDDDNEDCPDAQLLWEVLSQIQEQTQ